MSNVIRDENRVPTLSAISNADGSVVVPLQADPATGRLLIDATGTVTGVQYTEGDTDASITGTAALGEGPANALIPVKVDADGHVQVDVLSGGGGSGGTTAVTDGEAVDVADTATLLAGTDGSNYQIVKTDANGEMQVDVLSMPTTTVQATNLDIRDLTSVSDSVAAVQSGAWTVTANAGTNLNTSTLALEAGGNLAAAATSLAIIDDWDESDRAKVNPIAGQAGVQGGSGTVSATTQRVVLATDVALPAGTNAIGKLAANSGVDIGDVDVTSLPALAAGSNIIGKVGHDVTGIADGRKTVTTAGTRETLAASTPCKKVDITAETDNTGFVVVGGSTVVASLATRQGTPLTAGQAYSLEIDNLADVYLDVTVNGDGVTYTYYT